MSTGDGGAMLQAAVRAAHAAGVAEGREEVLSIIRRAYGQHAHDALVALLAHDAAGGDEPPAYTPPTVADLARIALGGGGETIDPAYRGTTED